MYEILTKNLEYNFGSLYGKNIILKIVTGIVYSLRK